VSVVRYDNGELRKPRRLPNGWLRVDAYLTRTGVFDYFNADGTARRELRLPEEVFHPDSIESFACLPVTDEHPPEHLTADNTEKYAVGSLGDSIRQDGNKMRGPMLVHAPAVVKKLETGRATQISLGYYCDVEETPGIYDGQHYDSIQRNIRGNHVAIVPQGRAGPEVRVRMDAGDARQAFTTDNTEAPPAPVKETPMTFPIHLDGIKFDGTEQLGQAIQKMQAQHADALKKLTDERDTAKTELAKAQAKADAAADELKKLEAARKDAEDPKRLQTVVAARVALERQAAPHLDAADRKALPKLSDKDVKLAVLKALSPDLKLDGKSDDYLQARFDLAIEKALEERDDTRDDADDADDEREDHADVSATRRAADKATRDDDTRSDADAAYQRMLTRQRTAWKPKSAKA
jgi:hypothetical protein